jgi:hypothetical protein
MITKYSASFRILLPFALMLAASNCRNNESPTGPIEDPDLRNSRISVTNNSATLDARVQYYDDLDVALDTTILRKGQSFSKISAFKLKLRASVKPPVFGGITLQATHVVLTGSFAYVSYNVRGNTYLGGVDVFDVSVKTKPKLISQAIFQTTDVSALWYDGGKLYLAEATSDTGFAYPAVLEEITLSNNKLTLTSRRVSVPSFVATDVKVTGGKVFVTSGSGGPGTGGLSILNSTTLQPISSDLFLDARAVDIYGTSIVVMQGTPARLRTYLVSNGQFQASYNLGGATIAESKSTIRVLLDRAFVAAGDGGMKVVNLLTGAVTDSIARAIVTGLDSSLTVTNAVSVNQNLVFMANGEAGVYVAQAAVNLETTPLAATNLKLLGKMQFGSAESANFVASSNNLLFIATGLGGLKVVEIQ